MAYDRYRHNVVSLLHFDGANGSTSFIDQRGKIWTAQGGASLTTSTAAFGTSSGNFTGSGSISTPDHADFDFAGGDFTIELMASAASFPGNGGTAFLCAHRNTGTSSNAWSLAFSGSAAGVRLRFAEGVTGADRVYGRLLDGAIATNEWHHYAVSRNGNELRLFCDGIQLGAPFNVAGLVLVDSSARVRIGAADSSAIGFFNGRIDEFRVTKGVGRYTENFAPPTEPYELIGIPISGTVMRGTPPEPAERRVAIYRVSDCVLLGASISDTDGQYAVATNADAGESVIGLCFPHYGLPPARNTFYALGARCWIGEPAPIGHWYECEQAGTSGSTAPTWPTDGSTVNDGTVIWRDKGVMERPWAEGPFIAEVDD